MADHLIIEVVEGPDAGTQAPLTAVIIVGRERHDLQLHDDLASRRHARFSVEAGGPAFVEDLGSSNGTYVNGEEIYAPTRVTPGDVVVIGVSVIQVRTTQQFAAEGTAVHPIPPPLAKAAAKPDYVPRTVATGAISQPDLDRLLDARVKAQARTAPIGILVLVAFAIVFYLALR